VCRPSSLLETKEPNHTTARKPGDLHSIKGTEPLDFFASGCFSVIIFFQAPENSIRVTSNFFENSGDICKSRCTTGINDTGVKFATDTVGVVDTGVNATPVANYGAPCATNISANFEKNRNGPHGILWGLGETGS
jgi:hypothetical protein